MLEITGSDLGPSRRITGAGTQILDRSLVAEPFHSGRQLMVSYEETIEIFPADFQQVGLGG